MAQMEADKRAEKRKRGNGFCRFLSILYTILAAAFVVLLIKMCIRDRCNVDALS